MQSNDSGSARRGRGFRGPPAKRFKIRSMAFPGQIQEEEPETVDEIHETEDESCYESCYETGGAVIIAQAQIVSEPVLARRLTDEEAETVRGNGTALIVTARRLTEEEERAFASAAVAVQCSPPPSPPPSPPLIPYPPAGKCGVCATDVSEGEKRMVGAQCVHDRCEGGVANDTFRAFCQKCGLGVWQRRDVGRRGDSRKRYWHGECYEPAAR